MPEKPTPDDIKYRRDHLLELWSGFRDQCKLIDEFLFGTFDVWPANSNNPSYHPARAPAIVNHAVDNLISHDPIFHRYPIREDSEVAQERADESENALKGIFRQMALEEPLLTGKQANRHMVAYGYTVLEGPLRSREGRPRKPSRPSNMSDDDWREREITWEAEKRAWMPFRLRAPHPSSVLLNPQEKRPTIAIKHAPRYAHELNLLSRNLKQRFPRSDVDVYDIPNANNPYEEIMTDEWWDEDWHLLMTANGQMVFAFPNPSKSVPYGQAFSGWSNYPTGDRTDMSLDPKWLAHGLLHDSLESLRANAQFASAWHNALVIASFRHRFTSGDAEELDEQLEQGSDVTVEAPEGKDSIWWEDTPDLPNWLFEGNRLLLSDIEFATFSQAIAGIREQGVTTVGQQAILSTAANRKFVSPILQMQHLYSNAASGILRLTNAMQETIFVDGHKLTPDNIANDYSVNCTLEVVDPVLLFQEREMAMREHQQRLISDEDYRSLAKKGDESGIRDRIIKEDVRNLPQFRLRIMAETAREFGMEDLAMQLEQAAQGQGGEEGSTNGTGGQTGANNNNALLDAGRGMREAVTGNVPGQPRRGQNLAAEDSIMSRSL